MGKCIQAEDGHLSRLVAAAAAPEGLAAAVRGRATAVPIRIGNTMVLAGLNVDPVVAYETLLLGQEVRRGVRLDLGLVDLDFLDLLRNRRDGGIGAAAAALTGLGPSGDEPHGDEEEEEDDCDADADTRHHPQMESEYRGRP